MALNMTREEGLQKLTKELKGIRFAMMTTLETDGTLHSRPMATHEIEADGSLWFFTHADTPKVDEVEQHQQVNLGYADPDDNRFVSIAGIARVVRDKAKMQDLWSDFLKAWFPLGLNDPELALLKVEPQGAEYWDGNSTSMVRLANIARAAFTGQRDTGGANEKLSFDRGESLPDAAAHA